MSDEERRERATVIPTEGDLMARAAEIEKRATDRANSKARGRGESTLRDFHVSE